MQIPDLSNVLMHITVMEFQVLNCLAVNRQSAQRQVYAVKRSIWSPTKDNIRNGQSSALEYFELRIDEFLSVRGTWKFKFATKSRLWLVD